MVKELDPLALPVQDHPAVAAIYRFKPECLVKTLGGVEITARQVGGNLHRLR